MLSQYLALNLGPLGGGEDGGNLLRLQVRIAPTVGVGKCLQRFARGPRLSYRREATGNWKGIA